MELAQAKWTIEFYKKQAANAKAKLRSETQTLKTKSDDNDTWQPSVQEIKWNALIYNRQAREAQENRELARYRKTNLLVNESFTFNHEDASPACANWTAERRHYFPLHCEQHGKNPKNDDESEMFFSP